MSKPESFHLRVSDVVCSTSGSDLTGSFSLPTPLSRAPLNIHGQPVWEPPVLNYSEYIDEQYGKKREAVLKHTKSDVIMTTEIMDGEIEICLSWEYIDWVVDNVIGAESSKTEKFFTVLIEELDQDLTMVNIKWNEQDFLYLRHDDGSYTVQYAHAH